MNLVLIGYRGTGKSEVARLLNQKLGMSVVCLDDEIVRKAKLNIPKIIESHGWPWFRDLESEITKSVSNRDNLVIDTGGGVVLREQNVIHLRSNGHLIWLKASVEVIVNRIRQSTDRPSLTEGKTFVEEVEEVLKDRLPKYQAAAHDEIDTDNLNINEVADRIAQIARILD
ncbi:MAG: shikimate kinase [Proteobacteria bacterium]|nr:shikimate kinase [Pseudomonadota bacterium]